MGDYTPITPDGHPRDEAVSALQKAIRRGLPREAIYWASQIEMMGQHNYLWQRLIVIYHEDVGIAAPSLASFIETCRQHYYFFLEGERTVIENLPLINAVIALAHAPKSRAAISYHILTYQTSETQEADYFDVPDHAKDLHTKAGRKMGRNIEHFQREGARLENERIELDPFKDEAMQKGRASKNTEAYQKFEAQQIKIQKNKKEKGGGGKAKSAGSLFDVLDDDDNAPRGLGDYFSK